MTHRSGVNILRLAICLSHPIQYKAPLLRELASYPGMHLDVFYYSDRGLVSKKNHRHGGVPAWDIPLLDGYTSEILPNLVNEERWSLPAFQPFLNPTICSRLRMGDYDAIIVHSYHSPSDWLAYLTVKVLKKKVLFYGEMFPRGKLSFMQQFGRLLINNPMIHGMDACLAIGSVARNVYIEEYHVPSDRVFLAPYAVDNDFFFSEVEKFRKIKNVLKENLGIPQNRPVVLCVAAMVPKKHQQDLIAAMAKIMLPAILILIGHGPLLEEVRLLATTIYPDTLITGFVNQTELPKYYAISDIFVLPSLWEEFGLVINEAMCASLPIITSNTVAASCDLVCEDKNGFTFPPGDVDELAKKINILIENPELRHQFGRCSLEIIQGWSYEQTVQGITDALDFTLHNK